MNNVSIITSNYILFLLIESCFNKIVKIRSKTKILFDKSNMRNKNFQFFYSFLYIFLDKINNVIVKVEVFYKKSNKILINVKSKCLMI